MGKKTSNKKEALKQLKLLKSRVPKGIKKVSRCLVQREDSFVDIEAPIEVGEKR